MESYEKLADGSRIRFVSQPWQYLCHIVNDKLTNCAAHTRQCDACNHLLLPKRRWRSAIIDRADGLVKLIDFGASIYRAIATFATDPSYGNPKEYDLAIPKNGRIPSMVSVVYAGDVHLPLTDAEEQLIKAFDFDSMFSSIVNQKMEDGTLPTLEDPRFWIFVVRKTVSQGEICSRCRTHYPMADAGGQTFMCWSCRHGA